VLSAAIAPLSQIGDVLLASAFVSYAGPFNMLLRNQLVEEKWRPDLIQRNIPLSEGIKPLDLLTDDTARAKWANEGLPIDPLSVENGAIMTNASRWPLMIDPQLQVRMGGTIVWSIGGCGLAVSAATLCSQHECCAKVLQSLLTLQSVVRKPALLLVQWPFQCSD
jgi:hypothetical protein